MKQEKKGNKTSSEWCFELYSLYHIQSRFQLASFYCFFLFFHFNNWNYLKSFLKKSTIFCWFVIS
uniref:Uncharacterized protein n=1 Tax=Octopus bimaculoides TaxID=37653 RepID=A0A0L8IAR9_OCTBM